jgi:tetratricopeptide (TPR) repeat protein
MSDNVVPSAEEQEKIVDRIQPPTENETSAAGFPLTQSETSTNEGKKEEDVEDEEEEEGDEGEEGEKGEVDPEESLEMAKEHLAVGNSLMDQGLYSEATDAFSEALTIMNETFGELAPECAEFYLRYGKALALCANASATEEDALSAFIAGAGGAPSASSSSSAPPTESKNQETFQIAWESLETARVILSKEGW